METEMILRLTKTEMILRLKKMPVSRIYEKVFGDFLVRKYTSKTYVLYRRCNAEYLGRFVGAERVARKICGDN